MSPTASRSSLRGAGGVDPSAPGNIIRAALAFESVATIGVGAYYLFFPHHYLLRTMGAAAAQVTTTALQSAQQLGAVYILVGASVALFISNTKNAIESRHIFYRVALVFELLYIPLLVWQAFMMEGGMLRESLLVGAGQFVPLLLLRILTLGWKPEWFGRFQEGRKIE